jgi:Flp pilus assembly protein TadD
VYLLSARLRLGVIFAASLALIPAAGATDPISIDYPLAGAIFPPDFHAPTFLWRDPSPSAFWAIDITFESSAPAIHVPASGERLSPGRIDPRCVSPTNELPKLTPEQAAARSWKPDAETWTAIKKNSSGTSATVTITGYADASRKQVLSRGQVSISTSRDPVGAPIFYRDVPLMPSETEKGVIKPLASSALPLIQWRLRNVSEDSSRIVMQGLHSCANCHSASLDGKTMGMDLDGPRNDKGLYAIFPIQPQSTIANANVVAWSNYTGKLGGKLRVGFMSQVSPRGEYVVTTINDTGPDRSDYQRRVNLKDFTSNYFVANFKDYRFLQVFYPTRGIIAWYSRATGRLQPLSGADDPQYVHTNAVWTPDGKFLIFARARAREPYPEGGKMPHRANDPEETQIQYDLYRIPFNGGAGGRAEPIPGASQNGMSNSFPKVSPDGRWIVFVKCRNGQLMRPDGQLYIVPVGGGEARRMRCNTPLMNSWHSFSPNGRWLVFSSKSRSPYTQMYLTHIDERGNDSPAILIENSTAANRAVNIPEFLNIPPDGLLKINVPVADLYRLIDVGEEQLSKRQYAAAIESFNKALAQDPNEAFVHNSLGVALSRTGRADEAAAHYREAIARSPDFPDPHNNLGAILLAQGRFRDAGAEFQRAIDLNPDYAEAHTNLGTALAQSGRVQEAIPHLRRGVELSPGDVNGRRNLALALFMTGHVAGAIEQAEQAAKLSRQDPMILSLLGRLYAEAGRFSDAVQATRRALAIASGRGDREFDEELKHRLAEYESKIPQVKRN